LIREGQLRAAEGSNEDVEQATPDGHKKLRVNVNSAANLGVLTSKTKNSTKIEPLSVTSVNEADEIEEMGNVKQAEPHEGGAKEMNGAVKTMP
jgi:hypothetical protein